MPAGTQREMAERTNWGTLLTPDLLRPAGAGTAVAPGSWAAGPTAGMVRMVGSRMRNVARSIYRTTWLEDGDLLDLCNRPLRT